MANELFQVSLALFLLPNSIKQSIQLVATQVTTNLPKLVYGIADGMPSTPNYVVFCAMFHVELIKIVVIKNQN